MKKKVFLINTAILTITMIISRILGIIFRVYISNKIGAECIGLFQLILTVYFFVSTITASGISLTVTRIVSYDISKNDYASAKQNTRKCILFGITISIVLGILLFFTADIISIKILNDPRTALSLKVLAPSLPFMVISACYRGYFLAVRKAIKCAQEQLFEQVLELVVFVFLIKTLAPFGIEYACCAIVIGTTVAEIVSCLFSYILYYFDIKKAIFKPAKVNNKGFLKKLLPIWLPVTGSSCLRSGLSTVENIMIPKGLIKNGANYSNSLAEYGMINGMVMPVLTFPSAFFISFASLLVPEFSDSKHKNNMKALQRISDKIFQLTFFFSIWVTGIFIFLGKDLGVLIYNDKTCGVYIVLLAPVLPLMYLDSIVDAMLKGLDEQLSYFKYNMIDSVIRVILIVILIPIMGINGLIVVIFVSEILNSTLSIAKLMKTVNLKMDYIKWIVKPIISIVTPLLFLMLTEDIIKLILPDSLIRFIVKVILSSLIYLILLLIFNCITQNNINWIKVKLFKKNIVKHTVC